MVGRGVPERRYKTNDKGHFKQRALSFQVNLATQTLPCATLNNSNNNAKVRQRSQPTKRSVQRLHTSAQRLHTFLVQPLQKGQKAVFLQIFPQNVWSIQGKILTLWHPKNKTTMTTTIHEIFLHAMVWLAETPQCPSFMA